MNTGQCHQKTGIVDIWSWQNDRNQLLYRKDSIIQTEPTHEKDEGNGRCFISSYRPDKGQGDGAGD